MAPLCFLVPPLLLCSALVVLHVALEEVRADSLSWFARVLAG
eukprot:COSAG06_NODE_43431_length_372_cov_0.673993_1_plen_41_part_10